MVTSGDGHRQKGTPLSPPVLHTVRIKDLVIGAGHRVVLQSMTSTDTNDIEASVAQCMRIFDAGADLVRLTTQGMKEVESLALIKKKLHASGYSGPLVADVHFLPKVAVAAAAVADKVRINPGNYAEGHYDGPAAYQEKEQSRQLGIIRERLLPLINICREQGTAIRVGVNHGSLSRRILSWYGDTPVGMVESAMEFIKVFEGEGFHNLVVSLKASNTKVMIQANRLLYSRMVEERSVYPLHLGVTEAGSEEDGRIKSAVGICTLLSEGIGDTIRVSLTEDPELEIPVGRRMIEYFGSRRGEDPGREFLASMLLPASGRRHRSNPFFDIGGGQPPVVLSGYPELKADRSFYRSQDMI